MSMCFTYFILGNGMQDGSRTASEATPPQTTTATVFFVFCHQFISSRPVAVPLREVVLLQLGRSHEAAEVVVNRALASLG
jgi:hypothetical protein